MNRKKVLSMRVDNQLWDDLETWIAAQPIEMTMTAVIHYAIRRLIEDSDNRNVIKLPAKTND